MDYVYSGFHDGSFTNAIMTQKLASSDSWHELNVLRISYVFPYFILATVFVSKTGNLCDKADLTRPDAYLEETVSLPGAWDKPLLNYFIRDFLQFEDMSNVEFVIGEKTGKHTFKDNSTPHMKDFPTFLELLEHALWRGSVRFKKLEKFSNTASYKDHLRVNGDMFPKSWRAVVGRYSSRFNSSVYFDDGIYLDFTESMLIYTRQLSLQTELFSCKIGLDMSKAKFDHTEIIAEEVMKRREILWDNANNRLPNLNARRSAAWKQVRNVVFTKCDKDMTIEQIKRCWRAKKGFIRDLLMKEKSYRTGTGGGVDMELEAAIGRGMALMTENDIQIARALGREASFCGLRTAESAVCADEPRSSKQQLQVDEPACTPPPELSKDRETSPMELYQQLSAFESETDDDFEEFAPPQKKARNNHQFVEEQKEMLRFQRLVLEKQYALCSKVDALLEKVNLKLEVYCTHGRGHERIRDDSLDKIVALDGDPNIEESVI